MKNVKKVMALLCCGAVLCLFGCRPLLVDGPGMERAVWSEFTLARCTTMYELVYSYRVTYNDVSNEAWLYVEAYDGKPVEKSIQLEQETISALFNLNLLALPEAEVLDGTVLGLTVTDSNGQVYKKQISSATENEILALLAPYLEEEPFMLDGPSMEYQAKWESFSLSYRGTMAQESFYFKVLDDGTQPVVTGECDDEAGNTYTEKEGIVISQEDLGKLREMMLEDLPEKYELPEDMEPILDDSSLELTLELSDGTTVKKSISTEDAFEIYEILLPYFKNN